MQTKELTGGQPSGEASQALGSWSRARNESAREAASRREAGRVVGERAPLP